MSDMTKTRAEQAKTRARRQTADALARKAAGAKALAEKMSGTADVAKSEAQRIQDENRDRMQHGRAAPATPMEARTASAEAVKDALQRGDRGAGSFAPPTFQADVEAENPYTTEKGTISDEDSRYVAADRDDLDVDPDERIDRELDRPQPSE
jgi:hypothetical protein